MARGKPIAVWRIAGLVLLLLAVPGCIIGRSARPSLDEAARGPSAPPVAGSPVVPLTTGADGDAKAEPARPHAIWMRGYWHWDGVAYVWQRGRWQTSPESGHK